MKKTFVILCTVVLMFCVVGSASAFFIDFENGTNGASINDITGVSFQDFNGYNAIYGDTRTGSYNTHSDDLNYGSGGYHHNGNMWLWAGTPATAAGVIVDFTNNDGTWFSTGYSAASNFYIDAYLTNGTIVTAAGSYNYGSAMSYLTVAATAGLYIDYVVLHDTGNRWLVDDMSGDASGVNPNPAVPEPATIFLMSAGLLGLVGYKRKRSKKN